MCVFRVCSQEMGWNGAINKVLHWGWGLSGVSIGGEKGVGYHGSFCSHFQMAQLKPSSLFLAFLSWIPLCSFGCAPLGSSYPENKGAAIFRTLVCLSHVV